MHKVARQSDLFDFTDLAAEDRAFAEADLKAVFIRRIVAAGDHHAGINALRKERVVEHGRRHHADIHDIKPGLVEAAHEQIAEERRAFARIAPEADAPRAVAVKESADGAPQIIDAFIRQVAAHYAANVVLTK